MILNGMPQETAQTACVRKQPWPAISASVVDAENHYYAARDTFIRHAPKRMRIGCVEWVELDGGRSCHVAGAKIDRSENRVR
jgi:hypothetical protein